MGEMILVGSTKLLSLDALEELAHRANLGDHAAGTEFLSENLAYWTAAARGIVHARHQCIAEDLVQAAVEKLLELWRDGRGPSRNARAYVVVSIRYMYIDELRSPRSRIRSIEDLEFVVDPCAKDSLDEFLDREEVARVLSKLTRDHQVVLEAVIMDGIKPARLVDQLDRSAPAISNLLARAKHSFRREWGMRHGVAYASGR